MHILFLSHYFPPEVNAPASRTYDHAKRWVKTPGVRVTVLTNHPNHPYGRLYSGYENRGLTREEKDGIDVRRVRTYLAANAGFLRRTLNYLFFMFASVSVSPGMPKPDIVVATSPQFFCAAAGFMVSRLKRCPFVFELRDLWPESIVSVGAMRKGPVIRILEKLELFLYRRSARVVALTRAFRRNLMHRGVPGAGICVIKNGADISFFSPRPVPDKLTAELGAEGKFVVSYIGTVGMAHAVDKIIDAAERLKDIPDILFLIVGEGARKEEIRELAARKGLSNVRVLPGVSKEKVRDYYAVTDLNLVTLRNIPLFRTVLPSKIFEIMAMGRPILCSVDGECREMIEQAGCGLFAEPENVENMVRAIRELRQDRERLIVMGENGRKFVELHFNRDDLARTYLDVLKAITE
ncbi:glycosyltransferase family 4 protein [Desulfobacterales bacterium HSG2]|nr:glycosyltransferase family 4 protein [Desulfobacterales bacterium HSG2]